VQDEPDQEPDSRKPDERAEGKRKCIIPCHGLSRAQTIITGADLPLTDVD
jgi:hypothetical protein